VTKNVTQADKDCHLTILRQIQKTAKTYNLLKHIYVFILLVGGAMYAS